MILVKNIFDLIRHTTKHRRRVVVLAKHGADKFSVLQSIYLWAHDLEKYLVMPILWSYYGGKGNRKSARAFYDWMNKLGAWIVKPLELMMSKSELSFVKYWEKIADCVDRNCDLVAREELSQSVAPPLENYLSEKQIKAAERLLKYYDIITAGLHLKKDNL